MDLIYLTSFFWGGVTQNCAENTSSPSYPPPPRSLLLLSCLHGVYLLQPQPTLTDCHWLKPTVDTGSLPVPHSSVGFVKCIKTCTHRSSIIQSTFTAPETPEAPPIRPSLPQPLATTLPVTVSILLPFLGFLTVGPIQDAAFRTDFFFLVRCSDVCLSRCVADGSLLRPVVHRFAFPFCQRADSHLDCLKHLAVTNNAAHRFSVWPLVFNPPG